MQTEKLVTIRRQIMRVFFRLLYHELARFYDAVAWVVSLGRWRTWVAAVLPYLDGPRILEIGHGPGHLQVALRERYGDLTLVGLDASWQMSSLASQRILEAGHDGLLVNSQAQSLPLPNKFFHQVVATFPSEYIVHVATLSEIRRVLIPGGVLIILPYARLTGGSPLVQAVNWLFRITGQTPADINAALTASFGNLLAKGGFRVQVEWQQLENHSEVALIFAQKPF